MTEKTGTLLVLHGGALGDLVLTIQLALRMPGPEAGRTLHVISRVDPGDLSACRPSIEHISPELLGLHWLHVEDNEPPPKRLRELVTGRRVLNALGDVDSVVHRRLLTLGARAVCSFDPRPKPKLEMHITTQWQRALERQGLLFPKCIYHNRGRAALSVPEEIRRHGQHLLERTAGAGPGRYTGEHGRAGRPWQPILIHPGSGGRAKCWPLPCFLEVARRLHAGGHDVCFVVGPIELERWAPAELDVIRAEFTLIEYPAADDLLNLLAAAAMFVSNDSGPAHLASLLGTPAVTIFGPTSAAVWRPLGTRAQAIQGDPGRGADDWGIDPQRVAEAAVPAAQQVTR